MSHSSVSSMVLFLVLLLAFPRMDTALTTQLEVNKPSGANGEKTTHPDQVKVQAQRFHFDPRHVPHVFHKFFPPPRQL